MLRLNFLEDEPWNEVHDELRTVSAGLDTHSAPTFWELPCTSFCQGR
jgi:hypothetical protein